MLLQKKSLGEVIAIPTFPTMWEKRYVIVTILQSNFFDVII